MDTTGLLLLCMLPAMALTMLNLGIGPFGHPSLIHHHQKYRQLPTALRTAVQAICALILMAGTFIMLGVVDLTSSPDTTTH